MPEYDLNRDHHGPILVQVRRAAGMTQDGIASMLGYSRSAIANAERGRGISKTLLDKYIQIYPGECEAAGLSVAVFESPDDVSGAVLQDGDVDNMFLRRSTSSARLDGTWFALWESTAEDEQVLNSEELEVRSRRNGIITIQNREPSPENPRGGYLWICQSRMYDNQFILGQYISREPNVRSKGVLYLVIHRSGRFILGQWVGCNYDSDWARGLVVLSRERGDLPRLLKRHRAELPRMPYNVDGGEHERRS